MTAVVFASTRADGVTPLLTKTISSGGIKPFDDAKWFEMSNHEPDGFDGLVDLVRMVEACPTAALIRGEALIEGKSVRRLLRAQDNGDQPTIRPVQEGLSWLMLDIDKAPAPADLADTNEARLAFLRSMLPEAFRSATGYYQWSSSAGLFGWEVLSAHFFFHLATPHRCADLHKRSVEGDWKLMVDPAPFTPNQLHYVAAPVFEDRPDPLSGMRSGISHGDCKSVELARWTPPYRPRPVYSPRAMEMRNPGKGFEDRLAQIGMPHFHRPIIEAIGHYIAVTRDRDESHCLGRIRENLIGSPSYVNDSYLRRIYRDTERKFGN